jgi:hypothetical protein
VPHEAVGTPAHVPAIESALRGSRRVYAAERAEQLARRGELERVFRIADADAGSRGKFSWPERSCSIGVTCSMSP